MVGLAADFGSTGAYLDHLPGHIPQVALVKAQAHYAGMGLAPDILVLFIAGVSGVGLLLGAKLREQTKRDTSRVTFALKFPAGLEHEAVLDFLRALGGVRRRGIMSLPTLVFEVVADSTGIRHYLTVGRHELRFVQQQLDAHLPGIGLERVKQIDLTGFGDVAELAISSHEHPLGIKSPDGLTRSILANFHPLRPDQSIVMQWLVAPGLPSRPSEAKHSQEKHKEHVFAAVCRIGARSDQQYDAPRLIGQVYSALNSSRTHAASFYRRRVNAGKGLVRQTTPLVFPMHLNASELASVIGFPIGSDQIRGVGLARSRHLPPDPAIPAEGIVLGRASFPGMSRPLAITPIERMKHLHVVGATGCLHPDTPIFDPTDGTTKTVYERHQEGRDFHVLSLDGDQVVIARAEPPKKYWRAEMFRLANGEHSITVTGNHRVWDGRAYVQISDLARRQRCERVLLPSISAPDLSKLLRDVRRSKQTDASSLGGCHPSHRLCDLPPRRVVDSVQALVPLLAGVHAPGYGGCDLDDQERKRERNHQHRLFYRLAKSSSWHLLSLGLVFGNHIRPGSGRLSWWMSLPSIDMLLERSGHLQRGLSALRFSLRSMSEGCSSLLGLARSCSFVNHSHLSEFWVTPEPPETYYDFHVPQYENYYACGLFHHNTGKTSFLVSLIAQEIAQGFGVAVIDPKGDLTAGVLRSIPAERTGDVILLDPTDATLPIGFNVLAGANPELVTDQVLAIFHNLFSDSWGPRTSFVLRGAFLTLALKGLTLAEVRPLLTDEAFRAQTLRGLRNDWLKGFWRSYDGMSAGEQSQAVMPVLNKIEPAMMRRSIRATLGQAASGFDMTSVLRDKKILLLDLDKGKIGPETSALIGALGFSKLWQAAQSGAAREPFFCHIDEAHNFLKLPTPIDEVLAEARSKNLGLTLAHQYTGQLTSSLREGLTNARNKVVFQLGSDDARVMAKELVPLTDRELAGLERYHVAMRLETPSGTSQTVTAQTLPPGRSTGQSAVARASSRANYGRPIGEVEAEIVERTRAAYEPKKRPVSEWENQP